MVIPDNGNYYSITYLWNENINNNFSGNNLTIFEKIGDRGTLENINLQLNISDVEVNKQISMSILTKDNYGTIRNVVVGEKEKTISLTKINNIFDFVFIALNNYGTIEYVETLYNIKLSSNNAVGFSSIAKANKKDSNILCVKNYGNVDINASKVTMGGLAQHMEVGASIIKSSNVGDIKVYLNTLGINYIGGIIGNAVAGSEINNVYVTGDITIYKPNTVTNTVYAGGIGGQIQGNIISGSYVNITKNENLDSSFIGQQIEGIYQLVGNLIQASGNVDDIVYCTNREGFAVYGGTGSLIYTTVPGSGVINASNASNLVSDKSEFATDKTDKNGNAILRWETDFENQKWESVQVVK